jgi:gliding motility-associated-like protein
LINRSPFLLFLLLHSFLGAQNIVPNPSFEQVYRMPDDTTALNQVVKDWFSGNKVGPLGCHIAAIDMNPNYGQPNPLRYQNPRTGQSMLTYKTLAYVNESVKFVDYRSYAATKLMRPIPRRAKVYAEFYINWHGVDCCRSVPRTFPGGQHGMLFTKDKPFENSYNLYQGSPQINIDTLLTDTVNWLKVSGTFISEEQLEYITIGNFYTYDQCDYLLPNFTNVYQGAEAHYFLEDVKVRILNPRVPDTLRICYGDSAELVATGEENHAWANASNPGYIIGTDSVLKFQPPSNTLINFYGSFDTLQTYVIVDRYQLDLGKDTAVCGYEPYYLYNTAQDADSSWWHGLGPADSIEITTSGWYTLSARKGACLKTDSIHVQVLYPEDYALEEPEPTCLGRSIDLKSTTLDYVNYQWNDGSTDSILEVNKDGWYYISIAHPCGPIVDSIQIEFERCVCKFHLPNAFTPNGDGLNDIFKPVSKCNFEEYSMLIANRWGQVVFETKDPEQGWNGEGALPGVYVLKIYYRGLNEQGLFVEDKIRGSLTLLR